MILSLFHNPTNKTAADFRNRFICRFPYCSPIGTYFLSYNFKQCLRQYLQIHKTIIAVRSVTIFAQHKLASLRFDSEHSKPIIAQN